MHQLLLQFLYFFPALTSLIDNQRNANEGSEKTHEKKFILSRVVEINNLTAQSLSISLWCTQQERDVERK